MKTNSILLFICLCMGILSSCKTLNKYNVQDLNGKWQIITVQGESLQLENMPFLEFNVADKKVHGNTGCNVLNSVYETDSKDVTAIKFVTPVTTMMACLNMDTENKVLQAINNVTHIKMGDASNQVKLVDEDGNTLLVLEKL